MSYINSSDQSQSSLPPDKEGVIKSGLKRLNQSLVLMHRTRLTVWKAMLITVFVAGFASALVLVVSQDWFGKIWGAPSSITNQATVTYKDSTNKSYSGTSNTVTTNIVASTGPQISLKVLPEEKSMNYSGTVSFYVYTAGATTNPVVQASGTADANGLIVIDAKTLTNQSYDLKIVTFYHLSTSLKGISFTGTNLDLSTSNPLRPKAGNLQDVDNIINSLDWQVMSVKWGTNDAVADVNHDGMVNTLDWGIMNKNWLVSGD